MPIINCLQCGKIFNARGTRVKHCSLDCGNASKERQVDFECMYCGKQASKCRSDYKKHKRHFCSRECSDRFRSETWRGKDHWNYGTTFSTSHKQKLSESNKEYWSKPENKKRRQGENNPAWNGGVTPQDRIDRTCNEYYEWQKAVYVRDRYTCQRCLDTTSGIFNAHHIIPFCIAPEERFEVSNGATLCEDCHKHVHMVEMGGYASLRDGA